MCSSDLVVNERARVAKMANRAIMGGGDQRIDGEGRLMEKALLIDTSRKSNGNIGFKRRWVWRVKPAVSRG